MKKIFLVSILSIFCISVSMASDMKPAGGYYETSSENCDMAAMQRTLDNATADRRAVITVVKCVPRATAPAVELDDVCIDCAAPMVERVIDRRVYVEETVQRYEPVVRYVPAGKFTRTRRVCNECGM